MSTRKKSLNELVFIPCLNEHEEAWLEGYGVAPVIIRIKHCVAASCGNNIGCTHHVMLKKDDARERLKEGQISAEARETYEAWMEIAGLLDDLKRVRVKGDMRGDNCKTYLIRNDDGVFVNHDILKLRDIADGLKEDARFAQKIIDILLVLISSAIILIENDKDEIRKTQETIFDRGFIQAKLFFNEAMGEIMAEIRKKRGD